MRRLMPVLCVGLALAVSFALADHGESFGIHDRTCRALLTPLPTAPST